MNPEPPPFDMETIVSEVEERLAAYDDALEVSVLGTAVAGISEARHADFGITGTADTGIIYAKGQALKKVATKQLVEELFEEIDKYYEAGEKVVFDHAQAAEAACWLSENADDAAV